MTWLWYLLEPKAITDHLPLPIYSGISEGKRKTNEYESHKEVKILTLQRGMLQHFYLSHQDEILKTKVYGDTQSKD